MMNNGKICVSVCAATAAELFEQIERAAEVSDVVEIRFDCLKSDELPKVKSELKNLRERTGKPFLITFRPADQGGQRELDFFGDRLDFWLHERAIRGMDFVDVEFDLFCDEGHNWKLFKIKDSKIICSYHNFQRTYPKLDKMYRGLADTTLKFRAESKEEAGLLKTGIEDAVIKIATQTGDITDAIPIWRLLKKAKSENREIIPIAMGESGKWTRILGLAHGAFMTYASLDAGSETAPGQVSARDLIDVYRAKQLDENTEVYGILGSHAGVSLSPYMHNAAFAHHGLNAVFVPLQTHDLGEFMRRMVKPATREIDLNFRGFAVTIPHKQSIIEHLDELDETARRIGAVNTVKITDGRLCGYNTDAAGFIDPLIDSYGDLTGARVAVLGAGGAARACVYALRAAGADVTVFARDPSKAEILAADFKVELRQLATSGKRRTNYDGFDILVNTTPLGMKGKTEAATPAVAEDLKGLRTVYDLVYIPFQTSLMKEADRAEVPKIGGLAMLVGQAAAQQRIWTGRPAPVDEMSRAALDRLG